MAKPKAIYLYPKPVLLLRKCLDMHTMLIHTTHTFITEALSLVTYVHTNVMPLVTWRQTH